MNFYAVSTFVEAGNAYINGVTEKRPIVKNGKVTGDKQLVTVRGVAVWTPVDVSVVEQKGGLVTAASTKDYSSQMANTIIGIRKFNMDHKEEVKNFIRAFSEGGDMVKAYSDALKKAGEISAKIYGQENGAYWVKFYRGAVATDVETGENVHCGGSAVFNLADNFNYYGIAEGQQNIYRIIYNTFGEIDTTYHPEQIASFPKYEKVVNSIYLKEIYEEISNGNMSIASAATQDFTMTDNVKIVSNRSVSINFESGSANFKPDAIKVLEGIYTQCINASGLYISIEGHTDATGSQTQNEILADQRANAVKNWLQKRDPKNFPDSRFVTVEGYADNSTRRVDIAMGRAQ
jgi:outer membrane protein OmpA-like peptidoglycan-associated protein